MKLLNRHPIQLILVVFLWFIQPGLVESVQLVSPRLIQKVEVKYGKSAADRLRAWQKLVDNNQNASEIKKLRLVNDFFNKNIAWQTDEKVWGKQDYWASPIESLVKGAGDCEDFVIAKYFTLKALGVPVSKMYLTYVKALNYNQAHMVLTYFSRPKSVPLVLDNINKSIKKATQRRDLKPVYSFNGDGLWKAKAQGKGDEIPGGASQLKNWQDLLTRIKI